MSQENEEQSANTGLAICGCLDHFWLNGIRAKLSRYRPCARDHHGNTICDNSCVLHRVIIDVLGDELPRITLRQGTLVCVLDATGIYRNGSVQQQEFKEASNNPYVDLDTAGQRAIPTWTCLVEDGDEQKLQANIHQSQIRPRLTRAVTVEYVRQTTGVDIGTGVIRECYELRRGDTAVTVDGVERAIVVNDTDLMLLFDEDCNLFSYLQVQSTAQMTDKSQMPSLLRVGDNLTWTAPSILCFTPPSATDANASSTAATIDLIVDMNQDDGEQQAIEHQFGFLNLKFNALGMSCADQTTTTDGVTDSLVAQQRLLQQFLEQVGNCQKTFDGLKDAVAQMNSQQLLAATDEKQLMERMASALAQIDGICNNTKIRHDALWQQRNDFHHTVLNSVENIQRDFEAVAIAMKRQYEAGGREEGMQGIIDVLREVKLLAREGVDCNDSASTTVGKIRDALRSITFKWRAETATGASSSTPMVDTAMRNIVIPLPLKRSASDDALGAHVAGQQLSAGAAHDDKPTPSKRLKHDTPLLPSIDAVSSDVEGTKRSKEKDMQLGSTSSDSDIQVVDEVGKGNARQQDGQKKPSTAASEDSDQVLPPLMKHPKQPSLKLRYWGEKLPTEVHFIRRVIVMPAQMQAKAQSAAGELLPPDANEKDLMAHLRTYCGHIIDAITSLDTEAIPIWLPQADDSPRTTVALLLKQQNVGLEYTLQSYMDMFEPVKSSQLLRCCHQYIAEQKDEFLKARSILEKAVKDKRVLSHLY